MQKLWSPIKNISQTIHSHLELRRGSVVFGMPAGRGFFGLDYRLSDCVENKSERNSLPGLPKTADRQQLEI